MKKKSYEYYKSPSDDPKYRPKDIRAFCKMIQDHIKHIPKDLVNNNEMEFWEVFAKDEIAFCHQMLDHFVWFIKASGCE